MVTITRAKTTPITDPVHVAIQPMKVKRIMLNRADIGTVYCACLPLVDIRTPRITIIVATRLMNVPAWVGDIPRVLEASINCCSQITFRPP
ncbi:hypothetical protein ES703_87959 [subsurface metagenome]